MKISIRLYHVLLSCNFVKFFLKIKIMKHRIIVISLITCLFSISLNLFSQTNVLYFMENVPTRNELNPAFVPTQKVYVTLPSNSYMGLMTNSFAPSDFLKTVDGEMTIPFSENGDRQGFLSSLKPENYIHTDAKINLLGFGFKVGKNYFSVGASQRFLTSLSVPYDLAWLFLNGLPTTNATKNLNFKSLSVDMSAFLEPSVGYSREILPNLSVGAKVKFLMGQAHSSIAFDKLTLQGNYDSSTLTGDGRVDLYTSFPVQADEDGYPDFGSIEFQPSSAYAFCGSGIAFDFGVVYKPIKNLTLTASFTDLGSMSWKKNSWTAKANTQTKFENISFKLGDDNSQVNADDSISSAFSFTQNNTIKTSKLTSHTRIGAEYAILNNKIGFGLLYDYRKNIYYSEGIITGSVNFRPFHAINVSLAYSQLNAKLGTLGAGLDFNLGPVTLYLMSDYIPFAFADSYVPKTNHINMQAGMILAFGRTNKIIKNNENEEKNIEE